MCKYILYFTLSKKLYNNFPKKSDYKKQKIKTYVFDKLLTILWFNYKKKKTQGTQQTKPVLIKAKYILKKKKVLSLENRHISKASHS